MRVSSAWQQSYEFACHATVCAPPPVGTGGSLRRGGIQRTPAMDRARANFEKGLKADMASRKNPVPPRPVRPVKSTRTGKLLFKIGEKIYKNLRSRIGRGAQVSWDTLSAKLD